uniref:Uncharacterized protein n=1 Tax=Mycena chlorophos TaxID=658473 RepID=A0ABQ0L6N1_MYCCL|nr:predicted protein [Mycena chlorophos]
MGKMFLPFLASASAAPAASQSTNEDASADPFEDGSGLSDWSASDNEAALPSAVEAPAAAVSKRKAPPATDRRTRAQTKKQGLECVFFFLRFGPEIDRVSRDQSTTTQAPATPEKSTPFAVLNTTGYEGSTLASIPTVPSTSAVIGTEPGDSQTRLNVKVSPSSSATLESSSPLPTSSPVPGSSLSQAISPGSSLSQTTSSPATLQGLDLSGLGDDAVEFLQMYMAFKKRKTDSGSVVIGPSSPAVSAAREPVTPATPSPAPRAPKSKRSSASSISKNKMPLAFSSPSSTQTEHVHSRTTQPDADSHPGQVCLRVVADDLPVNCEVNAITLDIQPEELRGYYAGLPHLRKGLFESWSQQPGGNPRLAFIESSITNLNGSLFQEALEYADEGDAVNPATASPVVVTAMSNVAEARFKFYRSGSFALFVSPVLVFESFLVNAKMTGTSRLQKMITASLFAVDFDRVAGFFCTVTGQPSLHLQMARNIIEYATLMQSKDKGKKRSFDPSAFAASSSSSSSSSSSLNDALPFDAVVPVFDGRHTAVAFKDLLPDPSGHLPRLAGEVAAGSLAVVAYHAVHFEANKGPSISFNIRDVSLKRWRCIRRIKPKFLSGRKLRSRSTHVMCLSVPKCPHYPLFPFLLALTNHLSCSQATLDPAPNAQLASLMSNPVPVEVHAHIGDSLSVFDLCAYAQTSRNAYEALPITLSNRATRLYCRFIPRQLLIAFLGALGTAGGGVVGSNALAFAHPPLGLWQPNDLNIIIPIAGLSALTAVLESAGYAGTCMKSYTPVVLPNDAAATPLAAFELDSEWHDRSLRFTNASDQVITVTYTKDETIMRAIFSAETTLGTSVLTPRAFIIAHPRLLARKEVVFRDGTITNFDPVFHRPLDPATLASRSLMAVHPWPVNRSGPCQGPCLSEPRRVRSGRGFAVLRMSRSDVPDILGTDALGHFASSAYGLVAVWAATENPSCRCILLKAPTLRTALDLDVSYRHLNDDYVHRHIVLRSAAIRARQPPYALVFEGLYLPALSDSDAIWVPVPLDDHATEYAHLDDLRTHDWIALCEDTTDTVFARPGLFTGAVTIASANPFMSTYALELGSDSYTMVVLFDSKPSPGPGNANIHSDSCMCTVRFNGDALALFFPNKTLNSVQSGPSPCHPMRIDVDIELIYRTIHTYAQFFCWD